MNQAAAFDHLRAHFRETALLTGVDALLGWDERTGMPKLAGPHRADQMSLVAGLLHQRKTDPRIGEWLQDLEGWDKLDDPRSDTAATVREIARDYEKQCKLPRKLVQALTKASVLGQQVWVEARGADDFSLFAPQLDEIVRLCREKADAIGYSECRYDALLDDYEPQALTSQVGRVLRDLGERLGPFVQQLVDSGRQAPRELLQREYPVNDQREFALLASRQIGFDYDAGRLDETDHPFCTTLGPHDCRLTTRYLAKYFPSAFFGTLHEAGHGIYEQGLRKEFHGLPPGETASLGIHESQSRLWENFVGRSRPFWMHFFPLTKQQFPAALAGVSLDDFYWAVNDVRPSFIRVEADEATYNLHIIIRFELEQQLIDDSLGIGDLPQAWNERYRHYLGIEPPSDASGVLQDIHWSAALFGYFATYTLGNLFAAQLFAQAEQDIGSLDQDFARGDFRGLLHWLRTHIHAQGRCRPAAELVASICGQPLSSQPLIDYLRGKLSPLYGLSQAG